MLKKIGIPIAALLATFAVATPPPAKAEVHVGVYLGTPAPVYAAPAYGYRDAYVAPPVYDYAPVYGFHGRDWRDRGRDWRDRDRREFRDHDRDRRDFRDRDDYRRDRR